MIELTVTSTTAAVPHCIRWPLILKLRTLFDFTLKVTLPLSVGASA